MPVDLRLLSKWELEFVRALRNANRTSFFDSRHITKEQQIKWYEESYLGRPDYYLFVIHLKRNNQYVGTLSIKEIMDDTYEIGNLMLLPEFRGQGIMLEAMSKLTAMFPHSFWVAHVKPHNAASLRLFKRAGFWRVPHARH